MFVPFKFLIVAREKSNRCGERIVAAGCILLNSKQVLGSFDDWSVHQALPGWTWGYEEAIKIVHPVFYYALNLFLS